MDVLHRLPTRALPDKIFPSDLVLNTENLIYLTRPSQILIIRKIQMPRIQNLQAVFNSSVFDMFLSPIIPLS